MEEPTCLNCRASLQRNAQLETLRASGTLNSSNYGGSWSYDADGNMTSQTNIATGLVTYYTWDYRNRLVEVKQESSSGTVLNDEKFTYDVNNNRIAVSLNGTPELYTVYDGSNPYLDFNGSGQLTERYLYNPNALSQFYGQVNASGTVQWFLTDNINSIRQVVSSSGNVLDAITYDPYGNILSQTNAANAPRFLYAGGAYDSLTGYDQFGVRPYNPADGRFSTQDWKGFAAGDPNLYRYVVNAPTYHIYPSGLQSEPTAYQLAIANGYYNSVINWAIYGEMCGHPMDWAAVQAAAQQAFNGALAVAPAAPAGGAGQSWYNSGWFGGMVEGGLAGFGAGVAGVGVVALGMAGLGALGIIAGGIPGIIFITGGLMGGTIGGYFGGTAGESQPTFMGGVAAAADHPIGVIGGPFGVGVIVALPYPTASGFLKP